MRRLLVALVALAAFGAAGASSAAPVGPLAPSTDLAGDMGGTRAGDGPSTPTGFHIACVSGRHVVIVQPIRNLSRLPVTLTGAALDPHVGPGRAQGRRPVPARAQAAEGPRPRRRHPPVERGELGAAHGRARP